MSKSPRAARNIAGSWRVSHECARDTFLLAFRAALSAWLALGSFAGLVACGPVDTDSAPRDRAAHPPTKQMQRFRQDADQGSRLAQYVLGVMYQLGEIVPQDYAEAAKWVQHAADQDSALRSLFSVRCTP